MKKHTFQNDYDRHEIGPCGKIKFSKKNAATKRNSLLKMGKEKYLRIYSCFVCNAWHLTKATYHNGKEL